MVTAEVTTARFTALCGLWFVRYAGLFVGAWLSLVERSVRDREAAGSNPVAPTNPLLPFPPTFCRYIAGAMRLGTTCKLQLAM